MNVAFAMSTVRPIITQQPTFAGASLYLAVAQGKKTLEIDYAETSRSNRSSPDDGRLIHQYSP